jgi:predicted DNA-binding transcriptional regulator YafY
MELRVPDHSTARFVRLVRLLPLLADGRWHEIHALATRLGVPTDDVVADLTSLQERAEDGPGGFIEGVRVLIDGPRVQMHSGVFVRPMGLAPTELAAIEFGLTLLRQELAPGEHPSVDSARRKVAQLGVSGRPNGPRGGRVPDVPVPPRVAATAATSEHLATLQRAWAARRELEIEYAKADAPRSVKRVRPWRLLWARGGWYLVAEDAALQEPRVYRLDRIQRVTPRDGTYVIPDDFDPETVIRDGRVFLGDAAGTLVVRYSARVARWIAERESGTHGRDGSYTVTYPLADDAWAVRHVMQYGADAVVLEPSRVRDRVIALLQALAARDGAAR